MNKIQDNKFNLNLLFFFFNLVVWSLSLNIVDVNVMSPC